MVDHVAKLAIDVVVISILPPIAPRDARLLWKRLRSRYPELPIIVGFWSGSAVIEPLMPPEHDSATKIATKLSEAVALVRSLAAQRRPVDSNAPQETRAAAGYAPSPPSASGIWPKQLVHRAGRTVLCARMIFFCPTVAN